MPNEISLNTLFNGPALYRARTPWGPGSALLMTAIIALGPQLLALLLGAGLAAVSGSEAARDVIRSMDTLASPQMLTLVVTTQVLSIVLLWLAAGRQNMRAETLLLAPPQLSWAGCVAAGLALVAVTGLVELAMYYSIGFNPFEESRLLLEGLRSPYWWGTVLVAVVLAPIWEELAFRGFLLSALAQSRLGIVGAGFVSTLLWTLMHIQYSTAGLASVFTAGVFLTWLVWRTGSMRAAIVAHAVGNAFALTLAGTFAPA